MFRWMLFVKVISTGMPGPKLSLYAFQRDVYSYSLPFGCGIIVVVDWSEYVDNFCLSLLFEELFLFLFCPQQRSTSQSTLVPQSILSKSGLQTANRCI